MFSGFRGPLQHAIVIWEPVNELRQVMSKLMIQLYTDSNIFDYNHRTIRGESPYWENKLDWVSKDKIVQKLRIVHRNSSQKYKLTHLIGSNGKKVFSLLTNHSSELLYSTSRMSTCSSILYVGVYPSTSAIYQKFICRVGCYINLSLHAVTNVCG